MKKLSFFVIDRCIAYRIWRAHTFTADVPHIQQRTINFNRPAHTSHTPCVLGIEEREEKEEEDEVVEKCSKTKTRTSAYPIVCVFVCVLCPFPICVRETVINVSKICQSFLSTPIISLLYFRHFQILRCSFLLFRRVWCGWHKVFGASVLDTNKQWRKVGLLAQRLPLTRKHKTKYKWKIKRNAFYTRSFWHSVRAHKVTFTIVSNPSTEPPHNDSE